MCIFVVEDEFLIRAILAEELEQAGYIVREAATGDEAINMFATLDPACLVLVTDIHMPGQASGIEVAQHARTHNPMLPVIYTTGRPDALIVLETGQFLIRKPYVPFEIISKIQRVLTN